MILKGFDGKEIYVHEWLNADSPKGVVQIIHGMCEHGGRYEKFAEYLNKNGYLVVADDHRGHGNTDSDSLGYCSGNMFADTVRDEATITIHYRKIYPELKYFVFGFSYGSFLTQSYIGKYGDMIDGAIIGGSSYKKDFEVYLGSVVAALGGEKEPAELIAKRTFGEYAKKFKDGKWLSADTENNSAYDDDRFCGFTCSNRFYRDLFKGLRELYTEDYISGLNKTLPLLLVSGKNDPVGNMGKGVRKLYSFYTKKAGMKRVSMMLFANSRHEFLNENQNRDKKWGTILKFLDNH